MPALAAPPQLIVFEPMIRTIRPMVAADRGGVFRILENAGNFTPEEIGTALELIDEWLDLGEHSGYLTYVLESELGESKEVLGYVTFGPTPLTEATYDLYWIAVDKSKHRGGVGKRLMKFTEEEIARRGGKLLLIDHGPHPLLHHVQAGLGEPRNPGEFGSIGIAGEIEVAPLGVRRRARAVRHPHHAWSGPDHAGRRHR